MGKQHLSDPQEIDFIVGEIDFALLTKYQTVLVTQIIVQVLSMQHVAKRRRQKAPHYVQYASPLQYGQITFFPQLAS